MAWANLWLAKQWHITQNFKLIRTQPPQTKRPIMAVWGNIELYGKHRSTCSETNSMGTPMKIKREKSQ